MSESTTEQTFDYYVSSTKGDDTYSGQSSDAAFKTIKKAIDAAAANTTDGVKQISVAAGEYKEDLTINNSITIVGESSALDNLTTKITGAASSESNTISIANISGADISVTLKNLSIDHKDSKAWNVENRAVNNDAAVSLEPSDHNIDLSITNCSISSTGGGYNNHAIALNIFTVSDVNISNSKIFAEFYGIHVDLHPTVAIGSDIAADTLDSFSSDANPTLTITNSSVDTYTALTNPKYPIYLRSGANYTIDIKEKSDVIGWCALYTKPGFIASTINVEGSKLVGMNNYTGTSNDFGVVVIEDPNNYSDANNYSSRGGKNNEINIKSGSTISNYLSDVSDYYKNQECLIVFNSYSQYISQGGLCDITKNTSVVNIEDSTLTLGDNLTKNFINQNQNNTHNYENIKLTGNVEFKYVTSEGDLVDAPLINTYAVVDNNEIFKNSSLTIQSAIDLAENGDIIRLPAGTHTENLTISPNSSEDYSIKLIGSVDSNGQSNTILNGKIDIVPRNESCIGNLTVVLENIKLDGENTENNVGISIRCYSDNDNKSYFSGVNLTITNCNILNFNNGILSNLTNVPSGKTPTPVTLNMSGTTIEKCSEKGIYLTSIAGATFNNCTFDGAGKNPSSSNPLVARSGAAFDLNQMYNGCTDVSIIFDGCTFKNNGNDGLTSGAVKIKIRGGSDDNNLDSNSYKVGSNKAGVISSVEFKNCTFDNNSRDVVLGTSKIESSDNFTVKYSGGSPIREYNFAVDDSSATGGIALSFYANGKPITITAEGDKTKISWDDGAYSCTYSADDAKKLLVFGGSKNASVDNSTEITMNSGNVKQIYGGGYGTSESTNADVTGTANISIIDGTISTIYGGGRLYSTVADSNISMTGGTTTFIMGGGACSVNGMPSPGTSSNPYTTISGTASINISGGTATYVMGGGQGYSQVNDAEITISENANITELIAGGSNGSTKPTASININGGTIGMVFSVNRGSLENPTITVAGGKITNLYVGASQNSKDTKGVVTGTATLKVTGGTIANMYLGTGLDNASIDLTLRDGDKIIAAGGHAFSKGEEFTEYNGSTTHTIVKTYTIASDKTWTVKGGILDLSDATLTNNGKLIFDGANVGEDGLVLTCGGDIEIKNTNFTKKGLYISGANDVTIQNCEFTKITEMIDSSPDAIQLLDCTGDIIITENKISNVAVVENPGKPNKGMGINIAYEAENATGSITISDNVIENIAHNAITIQSNSGKTFTSILIEDNIFDNWDSDSVNNSEANISASYYGGRAIRIGISSSGTSIISENTFIKAYTDPNRDNANILKATSCSPEFKNNILVLSGIDTYNYADLFIIGSDENKKMVTFNPNGGYYYTSSEPGVLCSIVAANESVTEPTDPSRSGSYSLNGWYDAATGGNKWNFTAGKITENTTLYANWTYTGGSGGVPVTPPEEPEGPTVTEEEVNNEDGTISSITETTVTKENDDGSKETIVEKEEVVKDKDGNVQSVIEEKQSEVVNKDGSTNKTSEKVVKDKDGKVIEEKTEIEIEDKNTGVSTSVEVTKGSDGKASSEITTQTSVETKDGKAQVDSKTLDEALKQAEAAKKAAEEKGAKDAKPVIEIEAENSEDFTETEISAEDLSKLAEAEVDVKIKTATGEVNIPPEVSKNLSSNADEKVSLSFGEADKEQLTEEQKKTVGDAPVFEFNLKSGENDIHDLGGTVSVTVPYELKAGEDPNKITVWYIDESGKPIAMNSVYDPETKSITFETSHFSYYFIAEDTAVPDDNKDDSNNNTIYYAVAAVIVILIIIALAYYFMKKKQ